MFCKNCGKEINDNAAICVHCGAWVNENQAPQVSQPQEVQAPQAEQAPVEQKQATVYCRNCGKEINVNAAICVHCGAWAKENAQAQAQPQKEAKNGMAIAGFVCSFFVPILGWIFGGIGLSKAGKIGGKGKGFAIAAIAIATVNFILGLAFPIPMV